MDSTGQQNSRYGSKLIAHRPYLINEAKALLVRLQQTQSFALNMPMIGAANISIPAQKGINRRMLEDKKELEKKVRLFILRLQRDNPPAKKSQKIFALLKLKFNALLDQLDIFSDALTQRGEHDTGIWLGGLDALAEDALSIAKSHASLPPLITYLDRGHGAAIRRARTRLPGGKKNPVAVIRVPRERMISSGIASSLIHEVGHQGAALLGLIPSIKKSISPKEVGGTNAIAWKLLSRWISEILSDCWSVGMLGISATAGLMGVVSLPRYFVFRANLDDPHPFPWIRVKISCAFGEALYPDGQWRKLDQLWQKLYPLEGLPAKQIRLIRQLEKTIPEFVRLVLNHRPRSLKGKSLKSIFPKTTRQPAKLRALFRRWENQPKMRKASKPSLVFAVIGQARADHHISPKKEADILNDLLRHWALKRATN